MPDDRRPPPPEPLLGWLAPYLEGGMDFLRGATGLGEQGPAGPTWTNAGALLAALPLTSLKGLTAAKTVASEAKGAATAAREAAPGIRAYHGSPHEFEKFSLSKIGTGEGAQAYGHGLYFAEAEDTAKAYRDALKWRGVDWDDPGVIAANVLEKHRGNRQAAIDQLVEANRRNLGYKASEAGNVKRQQAIELLKKDLPVGASTNPGRMYEVNIGAHFDDFLDWDKPLTEQSPKVREVLEGLGFGATSRSVRSNYEQAIRAAAKTPDDADKAIRIAREMIAGQRPRTGQYAHQHWEALEKYAPGVDHNAIHDIVATPGESGEDIYRNLPHVLADRGLAPRMSSQSLAEDATEALRQAGVPGIKYLDQGSRAAGEGSRNFVVFDDKLISILRKYGLLPPVAAGTLGLSQLARPQTPEAR